MQKPSVHSKTTGSLRATICLFLTISFFLPPTFPPFDSGIAFADDDGDDGDDGDNGGDNGGGNGSSGANNGRDGDNRATRPSRGANGWLNNTIFKKLRRKKPKSVQTSRRVLPKAAPAEIVAIDLDDSELAALESQGYIVLDRSEISLLASFVTRLRVPATVTLEEARADVIAANPDGLADFNHFYRANQDKGCNDLWCAAPRLVAWPTSGNLVGQCTTDAVIGVIDTGINTSHEALEDSNLEVINLTSDEQVASGKQHGTAVAAILAGSNDTRAHGLLRGAKIIAVDAFYRGPGKDERADVYTLVRSLNALADRNTDIINMSLSGPANLLLERMVAVLTNNDILIVAAAGNNGPRAQPAYPAAYPKVFAVTAIDARKRIYRRANQGDYIDFAAPGVNVWTAASIKGARTKTGTSFAAPFLTAALAAMMDSSANKKIEYESVKKRLAAQSEDLGEPGFDPIFGHGLLQVHNICNEPAAGN